MRGRVGPGRRGRIDRPGRACGDHRPRPGMARIANPIGHPCHDGTEMTEFEAPSPGDNSLLDGAGTGEFELEERQALRRVVGLSTELEDITEVEYRQLRLERVVLVGVWTSGTLVEAENSLVELARLAETAG